MFLKVSDVGENDTVVVELINGVHGPVTLDADRNIILRITNPATQKIKVTVTDSEGTRTSIFSMTSVVLAD